jgi:glycosyltransferase involved in cell wall biosynthesis
MHVSVVMAVYNGASTVSLAIDSIRRQTYTDWDLLIVDDGSTDGTSVTLDCIAPRDPRIAIIRNHSNLGLAASLNIGWRQAGGEFIARMDADDVSFPRRFEKQIAFLASHPEVDVLGTAKEAVDTAGRFLGYGYRPEQHEDIVHQMYRITPFIHPSVMMRRQFLEALGGYDESERVRRAEDGDLWLRGYRRFRYHNLQEPLIQYRVHQKPSMQSIAGSAYVQLRAAYREHLLFSKGWYALRTVAAGLLTRLNLYHHPYLSGTGLASRSGMRSS